ncbi:MAG: M20/M25/M40 family metallo-hydrolase [Lachnospiraceae bacterium]
MIRERLIQTFTELVSIDSPSLREGKAAIHIKRKFEELGIGLEADEGGKRCGSDTGNLYAYVKGTLSGEPVLLSAHMDTVAPALGKKAVLHSDGRITSDGTTVLGADDMAGITSIYEAVSYLKNNQIRHKDFEILFTVGEELYCRGAKSFDFSKIKAKQAYVLDLSGRVGEAAWAAPTILSFEVTITGKAAHAGFCPEEGIHAVAVAARAIAGLKLGRIDDSTTANIGMINGGNGINIIPENCVLQGEIRSLCHESALKAAEEYREAFIRAAKEAGAKIDWRDQIHLKAYKTAPECEAVQHYKNTCERLSIPVKLLATFGGSDNNVFAQHGIEGLVLATAMNQVHSCDEYTQVEELDKITQIVCGLLTGN